MKVDVPVEEVNNTVSFFKCLWSFQQRSTLCHGQRLVYSPILRWSSMQRGFIYLLFTIIYLQCKDSHFLDSVLGWMTTPLTMFRQRHTCSQRNARCPPGGESLGLRPRCVYRRTRDGSDVAPCLFPEKDFLG